MDKQTYYARQRPSATDLNADITNTENYGQITISNLISGNGDIVIRGFTPTAHNNETITVSAGLAYHDNGKKAQMASSHILHWDGTDGQPAHATLDRIDLVCIRHTYLDGDLVPRYFIDTNPASATYAQQVTQNVVVNKTDYWELFVEEGTPSGSTPPIPSAPSGYIPLFLVYIHSKSTFAPTPPTYAQIEDPSAHSHLSPWVIATSDLDNIYFGWLRRTYGSLELKTKMRVYRSGTDQSIGTGSPAKVEFTSTNWDAMSEYDTSVNHRWTASREGYYQVNATLQWDTTESGKDYTIFIYKNGVSVAQSVFRSTSTGANSSRISDTVYCAPTDYIEIYAGHNSTGSINLTLGSTLSYCDINYLL